MAEILGDVHGLHKSVKDALAIWSDADTKVAGAVQDMRRWSVELASTREQLMANLALQATAQSRAAFREESADLSAQIASLVRQREDAPPKDSRQIAVLAAVALATALVSVLTTLAGIWVMLH
ncbi:hypothetical protein [Cupriavidus sp. CP313]